MTHDISYNDESCDFTFSIFDHGCERIVISIKDNISGLRQCFAWIDVLEGDALYQLYRCYDENKFPRVISTMNHGDGVHRSIIIGVDDI